MEQRQRRSEGPLISIIMPAYNAAKYIEEAILSVLSQSYTHYELIIVEDCSSDGTPEIVQNFARNNKCIKYYTNTKNLGVAESRNCGLQKAQGEWIAYLDSDDLWRPDKLEKQVAFLKKNSEAIFIYTGSAFVDDRDKTFDYTLSVPETITYGELLKQNVISCSSVLIAKICMEKYPMMGDNIHEDFLVWLKVLKSGITAYGINEPLLIYRLSGQSKSANKLKAMKMNFGVYQALGLKPTATIYYMFWWALRGINKYRKIR